MPLSPTHTSLGSSIRRTIIWGFGISLLMLGVIAVSASRSTRAFVQAAEGVTQSLEALELQAHLQDQLIQAENGVRGFLIAADARFLQPFHSLEVSLFKDYENLRQLAARNQVQRVHIEEIEPLIHRKIEVLRKVIQSQNQQQSAAAAALIASQENLDAGTALIRLFEELKKEERRQLQMRTAHTETIGRNTTWAIVIATVLSVVLLFGAGLFILRDIKARRRAEEALIEEHHLLLSVMDAMPDQVYVTDLSGDCIIDNAAHREFLAQVGKESHFDYSQAEWDLIRQGSLILHTESPLILPKGEIKWFALTKVPLKDTDGHVIGMVGVNSDISEHKAAEEKLSLAARQMERSNRDLQDFASVASHDLQEPLRKILAFGDRLRVKCSEALGENGKDYLERMTNAAERMQKLIQSLLTLSRVTSKAMPFEQVDLKKICEEVVSDLEVRIEQSGASVLIGDLPVIEADPHQMRQLFQNLIANSLKFQKPGSKPLMRVEARLMEEQDLPSLPGTSEKQCQITFQDNGIGFDQKFAERIFVVFQRLHGRLEYEGTGIGLAVCRRITERHGGSIRAESEEGSGATFIVTLPIKQLSKEETYETR